MKLEFVRATIDDVDKMIEVQNLCFYADFVKYGECPGYNHSKEHMNYIISNRISYKIIYSNEIIGDIIVRDNKDGTYYLGGLCVIPSFENMGIGQRAIKFIESQFPNAIKWSLETPVNKKKNHYFYKKLGYKIVKQYRNGTVKVVLFEKDINHKNKKVG